MANVSLGSCERLCRFVASEMYVEAERLLAGMRFNNELTASNVRVDAIQVRGCVARSRVCSF